MLYPNPYQSNENPYNQYKQTAVQTASPEKLLIMLYDGAIKFANQAKAHIMAKNIEEANTFIIKTQDIITELMYTLDMDYEISKNLYRIYDFINWRLFQANLKQDASLIEIVVNIMMGLRSTWAEAALIAKKEERKVVGGVSIEG